MKKKAIIFDLDGVIVHTDKLHYQAWKIIADEMDVYFDERINDRLRGVSRMESLEIILENYRGNVLTQEQKEALATRKNDIYRGLLRTMKPDNIPPQVRTTLSELRKAGYLLALGSSSKNAKLILEKTGLTEYFDAISDGTNITKSKPDPEVFLKAAEYLGVEPAACVVVEDALAGLVAAKAAGMIGVGIGENVGGDDGDCHIGEFSELLGLKLKQEINDLMDMNCNYKVEPEIIREINARKV